MLQIVCEEADESIDKAYKEGYKQGVLEYAPQVEYFKSKFESEEEYNFQKNFSYFGVGLFIGTLITGLYLSIN